MLMGRGLLFEMQMWSELGCGDGHTVANTLRPQSGKLEMGECIVHELYLHNTVSKRKQWLIQIY